MARSRNAPDWEEQRRQVMTALQPYKKNHRQARIDVQAVDLGSMPSIRIRVIDPDFHGVEITERDGEIWKLLKTLNKEVFYNITLLILLSPAETKTSVANFEFENPAM